MSKGISVGSEMPVLKFTIRRSGTPFIMVSPQMYDFSAKKTSDSLLFGGQRFAVEDEVRAGVFLTVEFPGTVALGLGPFAVVAAVIMDSVR